VKNKKGLSNIIATVLIVLLALAAVAIVWGFIQPALEDTGTAITASQKCLEAEVRPTSCSSTTVNIQWVRGDIVEAVAIVEDSSGTTQTANADFSSLNILSTASATVSTVSAGDTVTAAAIILDDNGNPHTCDPSPTEITCT